MQLISESWATQNRSWYINITVIHKLRIFVRGSFNAWQGPIFNRLPPPLDKIPASCLVRAHAGRVRAYAIGLRANTGGSGSGTSPEAWAHAGLGPLIKSLRLKVWRMRPVTRDEYNISLENCMANCFTVMKAGVTTSNFPGALCEQIGW